MKVLLVGASGFIARNWLRLSCFRSTAIPVSARHVEPHAVDFAGVDAVLFLAGVAHGRASEQKYRSVNVDLPRRWAEAARAAGVPHFVYLSSTKVFGNAEVVSDTTPVQPADAYGRSKVEAEEMLEQISNSNFRVCCVRPPIVYGPGVGGKLRILLDLLSLGGPIPLGGIENRRSLVAVENLVAVLDAVIDQSCAGPLIVADETTLSTTRLIELLAAGAQRPARLFELPSGLRSALLQRRPSLYRSLFASQLVESQASYAALGIRPVVATETALPQLGARVMRGGTSTAALLRALDVTFALTGLSLGAPLWTLLLLFGFWDTGKPLFVQERVGRQQKSFRLLKFRSMQLSTTSVATHLVDSRQITRWGQLLRRSKLDELPQLINVLRGEMSLVGPRPCLPTQSELIRERAMRGVFEMRPGITGVAQVRGIDMSTPALLAEWDERMLHSLDIATYFSLLLQTLGGAGAGDRVRSATKASEG